MRQRTILIIALLAAAACSKPAEPAAIADICGNPNDTLVSAEGYLVLPKQMTIRTIYGKRENRKTYQLFLVSQPDAKGESVRTIVTGTASDGRNVIRDLPPTEYTFRDLLIYTNDGKTVGAGSRLKVTGTVTQAGADRACDLAVTKIEKAGDTRPSTHGAIAP